jgi:ATP-dependent Zn protease
VIPADLIEKALREHMRVRLGERAFEDIVLSREIMLSGAEAEDAARIAVDALTAAGYSLVRAVTPEEEQEDAAWYALPERSGDEPR